MIFKNKKTGMELMGKPVEAMIQLSTHPASTASFVLYESLEGHGFFLRESAEFADRFKAVSQQADTIIWTHKKKGGKYRVNPGLFLYDGDDVSWDLCVYDGYWMKVYVYRNGDLRFTHDFAAMFNAIHEPKSLKVKDAKEFASTQDIYKGIVSDEGFISISKAEPFYNALVSREGRKDVRVRGDDLGLVMSAAYTLLHGKL